MTSARPYRRLFLLCAWLHLATGCIGLIALPAYFRPLGIPQPSVPLFWQLTCATTACFGLAGFWIARDVTRNRDLIQLWLIVKVAAMLILLWNLRVHGLRSPTGALVAIDAAWVIVFTSVLVRVNASPTS